MNWDNLFLDPLIAEKLDFDDDSTVIMKKNNG